MLVVGLILFTNFVHKFKYESRPCLDLKCISGVRCDFWILGMKVGPEGTGPDCHPYIKVTINSLDALDCLELFGMIVSSCEKNMHPI
jgi:hypothetical protein